MHIDALGRTFEFAHAPRRVVSLVPSLTEILFDLGVGETVVGVTDFCIFPANARQKARAVGGTKNPKVDAIRELQPELVYMNLEENLKRHADAISEFASVFVTEPRSVPDVESLILQLASIHHQLPRGEEIVRKIAGELAALRSLARPFTFAVPIWKNPWMWCGGDTYVASLVTEAGGRNVFADTVRYPAERLDQTLAERNPEVIFLPDEPYEFTAGDADEIRALSSTIRVVGPFPGHLFTWHGTRTIEGLRLLQQSVRQYSVSTT